jgi:hypothetical protein
VNAFRCLHQFDPTVQQNVGQGIVDLVKVVDEEHKHKKSTHVLPPYNQPQPTTTTTNQPQPQPQPTTTTTTTNHPPLLLLTTLPLPFCTNQRCTCKQHSRQSVLQLKKKHRKQPRQEFHPKSFNPTQAKRIKTTIATTIDTTTATFPQPSNDTTWAHLKQNTGSNTSSS